MDKRHRPISFADMFILVANLPKYVSQVWPDDKIISSILADIFAKLIELISSGWILIRLKIWNFCHLNWVKMSQSS